MLHAVPSDDYDVMANLRERLEKSPCDYVADHQISVRSNGKATLCQYFHNTMFDFKEAGFDVDKAIANDIASKEEDTIVEKEPAVKRRVVREEPTTQGRRTSGSGYKVINKTEETSSKK